MTEQMGRGGAVSIRDVAERAGVALGTVSNVLNRPEKVAEETRRRVLDAIEELGFVRNDAARQLRAGRSRSLGLVVLDVSNPFFAEVARGAEARAETAGLSVLLGNSDEHPGRESGYLDLFEEQRVAGLLISPHGDVFARLDRLRRRGTPTVLVDRLAGEHAYSSVSVDDVAGGRLAAQHLIDQGRTRLAFVGGPSTIRQVDDRLRGAREAVASRRAVSLRVFESEGLTVLAGREVGAQIVALDPAERPDAIFAANDLIAVGLLQALAMLNRLPVPDEIALIGYDDIAFASATVVPLTSVRQPAELIGWTAVDLLLKEIASAGDSRFRHEQVIFQPELVVRASTAGG